MIGGPTPENRALLDDRIWATTTALVTIPMTRAEHAALSRHNDQLWATMNGRNPRLQQVADGR